MFPLDIKRNKRIPRTSITRQAAFFNRKLLVLKYLRLPANSYSLATAFVQLIKRHIKTASKDNGKYSVLKFRPNVILTPMITET